MRQDLIPSKKKLQTIMEDKSLSNADIARLFGVTGLVFQDWLRQRGIKNQTNRASHGSSCLRCKKYDACAKSVFHENGPCLCEKDVEID